MGPWGVLSCNELPMPHSSDPETSMFPEKTWSEEREKEFCQAAFSLTPQFNFALKTFGGKTPTKDFMKASNIIFSNG